MLSPVITTHVSQYGFWIVLDPVLKDVRQIHPVRIAANGERYDIYTDGKKTTLWRSVWHSEFGTVWFKTKKDAIRYLNSLTN